MKRLKCVTATNHQQSKRCIKRKIPDDGSSARDCRRSSLHLVFCWCSSGPSLFSPFWEHLSPPGLLLLDMMSTPDLGLLVLAVDCDDWLCPPAASTDLDVTATRSRRHSARHALFMLKMSMEFNQDLGESPGTIVMPSSRRFLFLVRTDLTA